jgi:plasmid maintenance system antidote protein VapI
MDIAQFQKKRGLSVTELAALLECSKGHASDLVNGKCKPGRKLAMKLERVSGTPWWKWVSAPSSEKVA